MAIDILTLLCYRLPLIEANSTEIITWRQLTARFGNRGEPVYQFKDTFTDWARSLAGSLDLTRGWGSA
jgi:hypothetical protein